MSRRLVILLLINLVLILPMSAQNNDDSKGKRMNAQQKEQLQIDEQLAGQYYRDQDYEQARDLYRKLYDKTDMSHYFQQYVECLLAMKDYDKAERELKSYAKKNPNYYKAAVDLIYVYQQQGKEDKAKKQYKQE